MKRFSKIAILAAAFALSVPATAFAGQWQQDTTGWWWQEDDGSYAQNTWKWLDGNEDGLSDCYYFDANGYMAHSTVVDGYQVDENGRWIQDGQVQYAQAAPQEESDAMKTLRAAMEKNQGLTSMDTDYFMNMQMAMEGFSMDMNMDGNMKIKNATSDDMQFIMTMNLSLLGESMQTSYFYTDGYCYYDMDGEKYKIPMDMATAMQNADMAGIVDNDTLAYIQDASVVANADGTTTIYYTANGAELNKMLDSVLGSMGTDYTSLGSQIRFDTYKGEMTLDANGNVIQEKGLMDMTMDYEGTAMTFHMYIECDVKNPGQPVDFAIPSTDGYQDFSTLLQQ